MKTKAISFCAIFLCLYLIVPDLTAQSKRKIDKMLQKAEDKLITANYSEVINICEEIVSGAPENSTAHYLLGKSYYQIGEVERALYHFQKISEKDSKHFPDYDLNIALVLQSLSQYDKALNNINEYLNRQKFTGRDNIVYQKSMLTKNGVLMAMESKDQANKTAFQFKIAPPPISSMQDDYSIAFAPDNDKLIINVDKGGDRNNVKYIYQENHWNNIYEQDEFEYLNSRDLEGIGSMTQDGKTFIFSRCEKDNIECRLWISKKINGIWAKPEPLPDNINASGYKTIDPSISQKGDTLFFASNRVGGEGNFDIWYVLKDINGKWNEVHNMGTKLNTPFEEQSPYYDANDHTLYFSSDGHPGYGKMDIFAYNLYTKEILNPGKPINSGYDDKYFIVKNNEGYLTSNRPGGVGHYDVYQFSLPKKEKDNNWNGEKIERLYAAVFAARLYGIPIKLMPSDHAMFTTIDDETKEFLINRADANIKGLGGEEIDKIKNEDHIIYTSLKKGEKELVDYVVSAYFSDIRSVEVYKRYSEMYDELNLDDKRKFDRVIANRVQANEYLKMLTKNSKVSDPIQSKTIDTSSKIKKTTPDLPPPEERIIESLNNQEPIIPQEEVYASPSEVTESQPSEIEKSNDEKFSDFLGIEHSIKYYQQLPFKERKRVDRIIAIRLVNEQYTLNPALSISDQQYYSTLSSAEKETINRLKLYFQSWSEYQQNKNLHDKDLNYLATLPEDKKEIIARLVVRRGIGVDVDNFVKFSGTDWREYKQYTDNDIENIKKVASLLKSKNQVFNIALAYAEPEGEANNQQIQLVSNPGSLSDAQEVDQDPITFASSAVKFESLYFDPRSSRLRKEVVVALNDLVSIYNKNPSLTFKLSALSADAATEDQNQVLSNERLKSVKTYLQQVGIPEEKISTRAFTEKHIENIRTLDNLMNRRVDVFAEGNNGNVTSEYTTYMIQPGNTLYSLSKANDITVDELMELNGLNDTKIYAYHPMRVKKNAELKKEYMVESSSGLYYQEVNLKKVTENEEEGASEDAIPEDVKESIERGEKLYSIDVNQPTTQSKKSTVHIVRRGEKLKEIASQYNVSVEEIMQANNLNRKKIKEGQRLLIKQ